MPYQGYEAGQKQVRTRTIFIESATSYCFSAAGHARFSAARSRRDPPNDRRAPAERKQIQALARPKRARASFLKTFRKAAGEVSPGPSS